MSVGANTPPGGRMRTQTNGNSSSSRRTWVHATAAVPSSPIAAWASPTAHVREAGSRNSSFAGGVDREDPHCGEAIADQDDVTPRIRSPLRFLTTHPERRQRLAQRLRHTHGPPELLRLRAARPEDRPAARVHRPARGALCGASTCGGTSAPDDGVADKHPNTSAVASDKTVRITRPTAKPPCRRRQQSSEERGRVATLSRCCFARRSGSRPGGTPECCLCLKGAAWRAAAELLGALRRVVAEAG